MSPEGQSTLLKSNSATSREGLSIPLLVALLPIRTVLLLAAQLVWALVFYWQGNSHPWRSSAAWWTVYGTLADLGCLALMSACLRTQGLRLRDLLGTSTHSLVGVLGRGLAYFLVVTPFFVGGFLLSSYIVYGDFTPHVDARLLGARRLPLIAALYSLVIWWPLWSTTEELTYQTFFLQRLRRLLNGPARAMVIVGFWWAAQHCALPFLPDYRYLLWRFLSFVPGVLALMAIYMRTGQIRPLIVAHSFLDLIACASTLDWSF